MSLDSEKAFDTVWLQGLIYKLKYLFGFHDHICQIIFNYITHRYFTVKIDKTYSINYRMEAGIAQGSILAPILYLIYISDIPTPNLTDHNTSIKKILYADDILIYATSNNIKQSQKHINTYLQKIHSHLNTWKTKLNIDKCELMIFKGNCTTLSRVTKKEINKINIKINNNTLKQKKQMKYLGITFTSNAQYYQHLKNAITKTTKASHAIKNIMFKKKGLSINIKTLIYKQLLRPILAYGFAIWFNISSAQMEILRVFERKQLRIASNIGRKPDSYQYINNKLLYSTSKTERIDRFLVNQNIKYLEKIALSQNKLIISDYNHFIQNPSTSTEKFKSPLYFGQLLNENRLFNNNNNNLIYYHRKFTGEGIVYNVNQNTN